MAMIARNDDSSSINVKALTPLQMNLFIAQCNYLAYSYFTPFALHKILRYFKIFIGRSPRRGRLTTCHARHEFTPDCRHLR